MDYFPDTDFTLAGNGLGRTMELGFGRARDEIKTGSLLASDYLRQGYENLYNQRAQGLIGGFNESSSRMGAQAAAQGLSPDVLQRLMLAPGQQLQAQLGELGGEVGSGLSFDLARLLKGTGTELAGLTQSHLSAFINKEVAKRAARKRMQAGILSGLGGLLGAGIGAFAGPGGAAMGAQLGGQLGGGYGGGGYSDYEDEGYGSYGP